MTNFILLIAILVTLISFSAAFQRIHHVGFRRNAMRVQSVVTIVDPQRNLEISREVGPSLPIIEPFYRDGYIPYACRSGKCSACVAKLLHGEIDHGEQQFLTKKWMDQGYFLTCSAYALSDIKIQ
eukprot:gene23154-28301_t